MVLVQDAALPPRVPDGLVLVTGAAGRIGSGYARYAAGRFRLRLSDRAGFGLTRLARFGELVEAELTDPDALRRACAGVDTVLHLAAQPDPRAGWEDLLEPNLIGCYQLFRAAAEAGCRRVVYASSVHAVSGYPAGHQVSEAEPVNPGDLYGVTKCFGEALGRYVAEQLGISVIALRIGAFKTGPAGPGTERIDDIYLAAEDLYQLIDSAIEVSGVRFAIVNAISDNDRQGLDLTQARTLLGYRPGPRYREVASE
jgi:UDP-glucose 4-epimerase